MIHSARPFFFRAVPKLLLVVLLALNSAACTTLFCDEKPKIPEPPARQQDDRKAAMLWKRFVTMTDAAEFRGGPFRISANLRYTDPKGENTRVSALLWGNGAASSPYPLRLDLTAGMGTVVAKAMEDQQSFTVYNEDEKTAYRQEHDGTSTLASFGVPVPLSLGDLTLLLTGRGGHLFRPAVSRTDSGVPAENSLTADGATYAIPNARLPGILELGSAGAPRSWKEAGGNGWEMSFEPGEINPLQPRRLRIKHAQGYSALIVVKEIEHLRTPYPSERMALTLPPGTKVELLNPTQAAQSGQ